jgi:DNA invertase Pin-like site-specific DNA recombinase
MTKPLTVLYARISKNDKFQDITNQTLAAQAGGWEIEQEFIEKNVSGTVPPMQRPVFKAMMLSLPKGSKIIVSAQDRLSRDTKDLLIFLDEIKDKGISLYILQYPSIDCASAIGIMVLTISASISAMELANLKYRIKMGLERTKSQGTILGAPKSALKSPEQILQLSDMLKKGELTQKQIAEQMEISLSTLKRLKLEWVDTKKQKEYIKLCGKQAVQIVANRN